MRARPRRLTPLPYTTLFRSHGNRDYGTPFSVVVPANARTHTPRPSQGASGELPAHQRTAVVMGPGFRQDDRSEEHTSELQSRRDLVCRLLIDEKKRRRVVW